MNRFDRPRQTLAIGLAALAGYVDAIGFLSADGYFVSFMSGNTTRMAVDMAQDWRTAAMPAMLIAGFVCGVAAGSAVGIRAGRWRKPAVTALVALLLGSAALLRGIDHQQGTLALIVVAMGAINNTFQRNGEVAVGLTYMTGALVKLGQALGSLLARAPRPGWAAYGLLWLGLAGGALAGAHAYLALRDVALWLAAGWALLATLVAIVLARREPA
ncbi:MAG: YoaK family protein [Novosphingobium sp.]